MTALKQCLRLFDRAVAHFELYRQRHEAAVQLLYTIANMQSRMPALSEQSSFQTFADSSETLSHHVVTQQLAALEAHLQEACTQTCAVWKHKNLVLCSHPVQIRSCELVVTHATHLSAASMLSTRGRSRPDAAGTHAQTAQRS